MSGGPAVCYLLIAHLLVDNHPTGTSKSGKTSDVWFRSTLGFRKVGGEWKIVHEHESVPFLMDGSDKAALGLKP